MKLKHLIFSASAFALLTTSSAFAGEIEYMIDHGTPGVIASNSKMARMVIVASGNCAEIPYEVITDGVKSLSGKLDLRKPVSLPLDFTTLTLSCSDKGVSAKVSAQDKGLF